MGVAKKCMIFSLAPIRKKNIPRKWEEECPSIEEINWHRIDSPISYEG
jgi:hypothetical protein